MLICEYRQVVLEKDKVRLKGEGYFKAFNLRKVCDMISHWNMLGSGNGISSLSYCYGILEVREATKKEVMDRNIPTYM